MAITTDAQRRLLDLFPQARKSAIANLFLRPIRAGSPPLGYAADAPWTPELVRAAVMADLTDSLRRCYRHGYRDSYECCAEIIAILNRNLDATTDFAAWALEWEALPPDEKERRKRERGGDHARLWMDKQPASEKQVAYLRRMGYAGPIDSKAHASSLIDVYTRGGQVVAQVAS